MFSRARLLPLEEVLSPTACWWWWCAPALRLTRPLELFLELTSCECHSSSHCTLKRFMFTMSQAWLSSSTMLATKGMRSSE